MAKSFVFLEIGDPEIDALISGIRTIATGKRPKAVPHVTLRGPYSKQVPAEQLDRYARILSSDPLVLNGIGSFSRPHHITVFVRVQHSKLQQVWWKPDFPPKKFGFNPHVTLYEGDDIARGQRLLDFLTSEDIKLLTWKYSIVPYVSDHKDLFTHASATGGLFLDLVNKRAVRADILARLQRALDGPNKSQPARIANSGRR
jgi:2'-5' RNA ligase